MKQRYWSGLVIILLLLDTLLTYRQNYQLPLDGDLVPTIFPAPWYSQVMHDPFGWAVLTRQEVYAGTNRFFAHAGMTLYWKQVPLLLQAFLSAIDSLYVASALFNVATQLALIGLLAAYVRLGAQGERTGWGFWLAVLLLFPLFQTSGFYEQMGITNQAITYTFFYAFPLALLLLVLWPFYRAACRNEPLRLPLWQCVLLVLLMVVTVFNGPVVVASVAIVLLVVGVYWLRQQIRQWRQGIRQLPLAQGWLSGQALGLLAILGLLSVYSLYLGRYNAENSDTHTLKQLYELLPTGIYNSFMLQTGLQVLIGVVLLNGQLLRHVVPASPERSRVLLALRLVGLFSVVYLLLLPFGGYRPYRPFLVRGDSILPIIVALLFAYGVSAYYLLRHLRLPVVRWSYAAATGLLLLYFAKADSNPVMPRTNECERWALDQMAQSPEPVVRVSNECNVLAWGPMYDFHMSELQGKMLHYWRVTPAPKQYQQ
ncbi:hypothetical protein ACFPAF_09810 [Hymenobacter endophyticus]|uniref:YfhO family protein n=1 Tax=Hymenobacter endophyticus TaxID=3076335 RepID=A0ABU3TH59_9BACT|nr:hypothetical protein [Hymenobacter endophyticus]MDU0370687.1 hypothetical protein [Hymenobacter endophyticus]